MKYSFTWFLGLFFLALSLLACGGPSTSHPEPNPSDKTAPTLSSSLPMNGASGVPINVKLGFNFSETIDRTSFELFSTPTITLGNPTWNESSTSVAFDNNDLNTSTPYTLTLKARDAAGNPLVESTLTFTTSDTTDTTAPNPPTGLAASPGNGQVTLTWQANTESDIAGYTVYVGSSENALAARDFISTNSKTITLLNNSTTYFFAVDAVDRAGNKSNRTTPVPATPSATATDTTSPMLQSSDPADGATDVDPRNPVIKLVFSEPMDTSSFNLMLTFPNPCEQLTRCLTISATPAFKVMWSEADTIATATLEPPDEQLQEQTPYTLTFGAKDKAGNALSGETEITFITALLEPYLVSSTPEDSATNVPATETSLGFTFSGPLNPTYFLWESHPPFSCSSGEFLTDQTTFLANGCQLKGNRTYRLSMNGITQSGKSLSTEVSFSTVADGTPPAVLETSPAGGTENVSLSTELRIVFDNTMDEASTFAAVSSSAPLGCTWTFNKEKDTLSCSPSNLANNTSYTVTVLNSARDIAGNNLALPPRTFCIIGTPCGYSFTFSTLSAPTTGSLRIDISGAPTGQAEVSVIGPNSYYLGDIGASRTLTDLTPESYEIIAQGFNIGQLNKPNCKLYIPTVASQTRTVSAGQTATAAVTYEVESCASPDNF